MTKTVQKNYFLIILEVSIKKGGIGMILKKDMDKSSRIIT